MNTLCTDPIFWNTSIFFLSVDIDFFLTVASLYFTIQTFLLRIASLYFTIQTFLLRIVSLYLTILNLCLENLNAISSESELFGKKSQLPFILFCRRNRLPYSRCKCRVFNILFSNYTLYTVHTFTIHLFHWFYVLNAFTNLTKDDFIPDLNCFWCKNCERPN